MADILLFMPVGTSIITNFPSSNIKDLKNNKSPGDQEQYVADLVRNFYLKKELELEFNRRREKQPDVSPAELSSLWAFYQKEKTQLQNKIIRIILIHSPGIGSACVKGVNSLILNAKYNTIPCSWDVSCLPLNDLDPGQPDKFPLAMEELAKIIQQELSAFDGEVFLNLSGGYKALGPYLTLMAMALGERVKVFYLYEDSPEIIYLPVYPIAFNLLEWRDLRGLLLPLTMEGALTDNQKTDYVKAISGTRVSGLIKREPPVGLNVIGKMLHDYYDKSHGRIVSEFGQGYLLLDRFTDPKYSKYLLEKCIPKWRYLSAGDHIPETVEHGRGHVQRLLELCQQFLTVLGEQMPLSDPQLFVLISSIWLHDLGHTGDFFTFEGKDGLVQDRTNPESKEMHYVYGQPDQVRQYHNFLSYELIKNEKEFLFPEIEGTLPDASFLLRSIELTCLFHRKVMPICGAKENSPEVWKITKGIKEIGIDEKVINNFSMIAAFLRVLDGAENQKERAINEDYYNVMLWVLKRQGRALSDLWDTTTDSCLNQEKKKRLGQEKKFKEIQEKHFTKHRWISNTFIVREVAGRLSDTGIYGQRCETLPVLGVCSLVNLIDITLDLNKIVCEIINPFLEEFILVEELLPFRIALFLLMEKDSGLARQQIVVVPNGGKAEEWSFERKDIINEF